MLSAKALAASRGCVIAPAIAIGREARLHALKLSRLPASFIYDAASERAVTSLTFPSLVAEMHIKKSRHLI